MSGAGPSRVERSLAWLALALILAGGFEPYYLRIFRIDRDSLHRYLTELPYQKLPGLRPLLVEVRSRTEPRSRIAIMTPSMEWSHGYEYAWARSLYLLHGRESLALVGPPDRPFVQGLERADYVACWRCTFENEQYRVVWSGPHGALSRKRH